MTKNDVKVLITKRIGNAACYNLWRSCASFPALGRAMYQVWTGLTQGKPIDLTNIAGLNRAKLFDLVDMEDPTKNVYLRDLDYIITHSPKADYIWSIVEAGGKDYRGRPAQSIIFTYSNVTAMILFLVSQFSLCRIMDDITDYVWLCLDWAWLTSCSGWSFGKVKRLHFSMHNWTKWNETEWSVTFRRVSFELLSGR